MLVWCLMRKQLSSALNSTLWSPNSFTHLRTWLISLGKRNLLNPMRRFTFKVSSLLVCFRVFCFTIIFSICGWISGRDAHSKLSKLREWVQQQPSSAPSYLKAQQSTRQYLQVGTLVTSLTCIGTNLEGKNLFLF